jgi:4-carboxymuconolactone decarboxylase
MKEEAANYLKAMEVKRGYLLPMHKLLAEYDLDYLRNYNNLFEGVMKEEGAALSGKVKEFVYIGVCIALGSNPEVVAGHVKRAYAAGAATEEILSVIQLATMSFLSKSLSLGTNALNDVLETQKT